MKKTITLLTLGFLFAGSVGCSTAPKQDESAAAAPVADVQPEPALTEDTAPETKEPPVADVAPTPAPSSSLGAASSGRGH